MAKNHPIWNSFAAGEVSPRIWSRSDIPSWRSGCAELTNFIATSHGPVIRRGGFEYLGQSPGTAGAVFGFQINVAVGYAVCITENEIRIFNLSFRAAQLVTYEAEPVTYLGEQITIATKGYTPEQVIESPWSALEIPQLRAEVLPGSTTMFFVCPTTRPQELIFDPNAELGSQWTIQDITFTPDPPEWSGPDNWPTCLAFFQGRSWFAGTKEQPETFWGSQSGNYRDFTEGSTAEQALEFTLAKAGRIMWLAGAQTLVIGTVNGEYVANSDAGVISPSDIDVNQQSSYGSRYVQSRMVGNITLYASPDGRKLRDVGYRWEENNWLSRDITFVSEHITRENLIAGVTWAQNPNNLIWMITDQGNLLSCTYERNYDVIGWHKHETAGRFLSTATVDVNGTSEVVAAVIREDGLVNFEWYDQHIPGLDSYTRFLKVPETNFIDGLEYLEGHTVTVLTDGAVGRDYVVEGGQITLDAPASEVYVGLRFISKMTTLPLDYTPETPGTSQHYMKRWNKIYVRLIESARPLINGDRQPTREPVTPMGEPQPVITQDSRVLTTGWDRYAQIQIEMELPLPCNIAAMFGELRQDMERS